MIHGLLSRTFMQLNRTDYGKYQSQRKLRFEVRLQSRSQDDLKAVSDNCSIYGYSRCYDVCFIPSAAGMAR